MKIRIRNGRVIDPVSRENSVRDVFVDQGFIVDPRGAGDDFPADHEIDASGCIVCPGLVDLQARLREPGEEHKATMQSELSAAIAGGLQASAYRPTPTRLLTHQPWCIWSASGVGAFRRRGIPAWGRLRWACR